jgi:hypothetical protein
VLLLKAALLWEGWCSAVEEQGSNQGSNQQFNNGA